jgi:hypothetical protein
MTLTLSALAGTYFRSFEQDERPDGSRFWTCRDTCRDEALQQLCFNAHDGMLPDDYKYQFIVEALALLADHDADEASQLVEADSYTHQLTAWLHSSTSRVYYLTEALEVYAPKDGFQLLALAQYIERAEVLDHVLTSLDAIVAERNGEA